MPVTTEQQSIIDSTARRIVVNAFAGTGKTTTAVLYARARSERILYLAYNKAVQIDATKRFAPNVVCKTTHALAFPQFGSRFKHKLGNLRVGDIADVLRLSYPQAAQVAEAMQNYLNSADEGIGSKHLPVSTNKSNWLDLDSVLHGARRLWERMQDVNDAKVPMSHDGYLKLFQLSRPSLPYDIVILDEAQDSNPVTLAIATQQPGGLLLIGDRFQAIYGFRGARDALTSLGDAEQHYLTHSFRFGPGIARIGNLLLAWHGETHHMVGAGPCQASRFEIDESKPYAQIGRTNMSVITAAIEALETKHLLYFVGGVESYRLNIIEDAYHLFARAPHAVRDRFLKKFSSLSELAEYADEANDAEMALLVKIVQTYTHRLPSLLKQLRARSVDEMGQAQRVFSTAHKSKGMEYEQVLMLEDYQDLLDGGQLIDKQEIDPQQVNLMYVAVTRASEALQPSRQVIEYWRYVRDQARATNAGNTNQPWVVANG